MKKLVILVCLLFLVTGCSVKYYVDIDEDLKITETAYITESDDFYKAYYRTTKINALNYVLNIYKDYLDESNYDAKLLTDKEPQIKVQKEYQTIEEYLNSSLLFNDYFEEIKYEKEGDILTIETVNFNQNDPDNPDRFISEKFDVIIRPAYKVKESNATKIDKDNNAYHFEYNSDMDDFKIFMKIDTSSKFIYNLNTYIIIIVSILCIIGSWVAVVVLNNKKNR